jgi:hypothetical protein
LIRLEYLSFKKYLTIFPITLSDFFSSVFGSLPPPALEEYTCCVCKMMMTDKDTCGLFCFLFMIATSHLFSVGTCKQPCHMFANHGDTIPVGEEGCVEVTKCNECKKGLSSNVLICIVL